MLIVIYLCPTINGKTIAARTFRISILSKTRGPASVSCLYFLHLTQNFLLMLLLPRHLLYHTSCEMGHDTTDCPLSIQQGPRRSFVILCLERVGQKTQIVAGCLPVTPPLWSENRAVHVSLRCYQETLWQKRGRVESTSCMSAYFNAL